MAGPVTITPDAPAGLPPVMITPDAPAQPGWLDRDIPLTSHLAATESGVQSIAKGTRDAIKGAYQTFAQPPQDDTENKVSAISPAALPIYRMLRGLGHSAADATQVVGAIHDINQSADPLGSYAKAAQETAGQGAGQAITALATEGAAKAAPAIVKAAITPEIASAPVRLGARAAETAINQKLVPLRPLANIMQPADAAEATQFKVPGRDFGLKVPEEEAPDATAENKPYAGAPKPKLEKELDATGENKPFAGGVDEYIPPKKPVQSAPAPRTVVVDPESGKPEFSDVVAAKQNAAQSVALPVTELEKPVLGRATEMADRYPVQAGALRQPVSDIVDRAIPPSGKTYGDNLRTKAEIDFHLDRGDVPQAEAVLDNAGSKANPSWEPPERPRIVPSVQNIRENLAMTKAAEQAPTQFRNRADVMDDRALQQEMNWDLENHGYQAASEARREFIARNSTGTTKADLIQAAKKATAPGASSAETQ